MIESTLEVKLQENQTGDASRFLGLYILSYYMYMLVLQFYSWIVLFSLSLLFVLCLLSRDPFVMLTITISLSWDPSHSPYTPFNPYTIPCITTGQGVPFAYLFLVMDDYSFSQFSRICCVFLLLILLSITFHDLPFLLSGMFYLVLSCSFAYSADLLSSI